MGSLSRSPETPGKKNRLSIFRAAPPPPEKDESEVRWLMSYSDFMMQLVCLFILLYSVSSVDTSKAVPLAQAWRDEAGIGEVRIPQAPQTANVPLTPADLPAAIREIQILMGRHSGGSSFRIARTSDGFRLHLAYEMFERGSAGLGPQGSKVADLAALLLQPIQGRVGSVEVVGHASADEENGSSLSLARAHEAYRWMTRPELGQRLDGVTLLASARGAHEPAADNAETSGRALNRRVDFVVHLAAR